MARSDQTDSEDANAGLLELFQLHGVDAALGDDSIEFPGRGIRAEARVFRETPQAFGVSLQLDVRLELLPGLTIVESFVGLGATKGEAVADATQNFAANSFHVLLAAFFHPDESQVEREEWTVGGRPRRVTIGNVGVRGNPPVRGEPLVSWFRLFEARIRAADLAPGTHWVRLYYGHLERRTLTCEVLLDNEVWAGLQAEMEQYDWPKGDDFYSVRVFLVIQDRDAPAAAGGGTPHERSTAWTPESAVAWLADHVAGRNDFTEDDVYAALAGAGVPAGLGDRAYKFTQIAWARAFLDGVGLTFSPDYVGFDADGRVSESGPLAGDPCFAAAARLAPRYAGSPGFGRLALMSSEVNAVNNARNAGSDPKNLVMAPVFLFFAAPTPEGMENALRVIHGHQTALRRQARPPAKPWWRFWG